MICKFYGFGRIMLNSCFKLFKFYACRLGLQDMKCFHDKVSYTLPDKFKELKPPLKDKYQ